MALLDQVVGAARQVLSGSQTSGLGGAGRFGAHFDWRLDYLPAVDNFTKDYLLRTEAAVTAPLFAFVSAKFSLRDEYNNRPLAGTKRNSVFLALGFSLVW